MPKLFSAARRGFLRKAAAGNRSLIDRLEIRRLLSVSMSSDGWTVVTPASDTRIVYVSSSTGNDQNNGLSPDAPVQSVDRGESLLRNKSADWLLFKAGDAWQGSLSTWRISGRSDENPIYIGSYGAGPRPLFNTGTQPGFWAAASSSPTVNHIVLTGLHFYSDGRDPNSPTFVGPSNTTGIQILTKTDGITIENCEIQGYAVDINLQNFFGPITNVSVRRNIIDDAYATNSHSQGLYAYGVTNLSIEENTFDHNGYNDLVSGAEATWYNQDCYISSNNVNVTVTGNIFARAAGYGLQDRPGGIVEDNLFIDDPVGMSFGLVNGSHTTAGGVSGIVNGNVFVGGGMINGSPFGQGIVLGNTRPGYPTVVSNNIFDNGIDHALAALTLTFGIGQIDPQNSVGLNDLNIQNNIIYNWYRGLYVDSGFTPGGTGLTALNDVTVSENAFQDVSGMVIQSKDAIPRAQLHFQNNTYSSGPSIVVGSHQMTYTQWTASDETTATAFTVPYIDSTRSLESYNAAIDGQATADDFLTQARQQSQQNWRPQYMAATMIDYMRGGFDTVESPHNWKPPTPPIVTAVAFPARVMAKDTSLTFAVTYLDDQYVDTSTIASGNLSITAKGFSTPAQLVSISGSGASVVATYSMAAPRGMFRTGRGYKFNIALNAGQVKDNQGFAAAATIVDKAKLRVVPRPKPPTVRQVQLRNHGQAIAISFSSDVTVTTSDLVLQSDDGQTVDPSLMSMTWDAARKTAVWTFPGEPGAVLPVGKWHVRVLAATIVDSIGQQLDGNHDGVGGDDFVLKRLLKE